MAETAKQKIEWYKMETARRYRLRTEGIMDHGYRMLRFKNHEVIEDLPSVLQRITQAIDLASQFPLPKAPSSP